MEKTARKKQEHPLLLTRAVMCENIEAFDIQNPAIVFSISLGKIFCFSSFENIHKNDIVFHKWFQRDRLVSNNRFLSPASSLVDIQHHATAYGRQGALEG